MRACGWSACLLTSMLKACEMSLMRSVLIVLVFILALASCAAGQDCTSYVVVNAYNHKLGIDLATLKAGDFDARMGSTTLSVVSSEHDYKSRLVVLLETDGAANSSKIGDVVAAVTRMARQGPDGQPVAFG